MPADRAKDGFAQDRGKRRDLRSGRIVVSWNQVQYHVRVVKDDECCVEPRKRRRLVIYVF